MPIGIVWASGETIQANWDEEIRRGTSNAVAQIDIYVDRAQIRGEREDIG
jgi:hypothetical protein